MPRPCKFRTVSHRPEAVYFKPRAIPLSLLDEVILTFDELESLRLADLEERYQEEAAPRMGISRQTFGNILKVAHKKVADALVNSKALRIEGGNIAISGDKRTNNCIRRIK
ncbi:MAG: DUF134 domain-containing protein [Candidatus Edwardsbacteria bacterium]|nr:DUF134 domain-containing protein [Candidatus Edwardsbacteria bacterium]